MSKDSTMKTTTEPPPMDWADFDAMTADARRRAAQGDADAQPIMPGNDTRLRRTPQVRVIRRALRLSQEEFAARFEIPLGTLRDWEQGRKQPDTAARAYLKVIGRDPDAVAKALQPNS